MRPSPIPIDKSHPSSLKPAGEGGNLANFMKHTGERRHPGILENTGFRVKHGMTKQGKSDLLRSRPKR